MSGGIEDVMIWDCDMSQSYFGIEIKGTKKRGGYVRDVMVRDCTAARILFHSVGYNDDGSIWMIRECGGHAKHWNYVVLMSQVMSLRILYSQISGWESLGRGENNCCLWNYVSI